MKEELSHTRSELTVVRESKQDLELQLTSQKCIFFIFFCLTRNTPARIQELKKETKDATAIKAALEKELEKMTHENAQTTAQMSSLGDRIRELEEKGNVRKNAQTPK